jgi:hypothetical protein
MESAFLLKAFRLSLSSELTVLEIGAIKAIRGMVIAQKTPIAAASLLKGSVRLNLATSYKISWVNAASQ